MHRTIRLPNWAEVECLSNEDNRLLKVACRSKLDEMITEMNSKASQTGRSVWVAEWAKLQCITVKGDRLVEATGPPPLCLNWATREPARKCNCLTGRYIISLL